MKFYLTLIIILFCNSKMLFSQVPGYLGKRITIETSSSMFPAFTNMILYNYKYDNHPLDKYGKKIPKIHLHYNQDFNVLYTIGRKWDLGLRYAHDKFEVEYGKLNYIIYDTLFDWNGNAIPINEEDEPIEVESQEHFLPIVSNLYEILVRFYPRDNIAPLGINFQLGFGKYYTKFTSGSNLTIIRSKSSLINEDNMEIGSIPNYVNSVNKWSFAINKKKIMFKNIYYTSGMEINIIRIKKYYGGVSRVADLLFDAKGQSVSDYDKIVQRQVDYVAWDNLFAFKFGIGIFL